MFTLAVPLYTPTKPIIRMHIKYKTVLFPKLEIIFYILDVNISNKFNFWNVQMYFGSLAKLSEALRVSLTLQETRSIHDSMNIPILRRLEK